MDVRELKTYIPDYLLEDVSEDIRRDIDLLAQTDPEFRKELESQRELFSAAQIFREGGLKDKLEAIRQEPARRIYLNPGVYWAGAAAIILILIAVFLNTRKPNPEGAVQFLASRVPDQISQTYEELLANPGFSQTLETELLLAGMDAYNNGSLDSARLLLEKYLQSNPGNNQARMYLAECYWQLEEPVLAIEAWEEVSRSDLTMKDVARLRLLAAMIVRKKWEAADSLRQVIMSQSPEEVQQQLHEIW